VAPRVPAKDRIQAVNVRDEAELDDLLSRPSEADVEAMRAMAGDLVLLGVAGKMGPTLALRARRAADAAGLKKRIVGVSRFSAAGLRKLLDESGIETVEADLLDRAQVAALPDAPNVIYLAGRKFGSSDDASLTWAMNAYVPALVCERYRGSRIVAFSSGNIYPFVPVVSGGASEDTAVSPVGEYAQSVLARERMFEYFSRKFGTPTVLLRLNYAVELRYGVLVDIGSAVLEGRPVSLGMGAANVIWQGDANSVCLRAFPLCSSPAAVLNLTGPETLSVRRIAEAFGRYFGVEPVLEGSESRNALLNNAGRCHRLFGYPAVSPEELIEATARWLRSGGATLGKPTHFETRDGKF
jgi:nucleoside-diphosphate-sugar epimerase